MIVTLTANPSIDRTIALGAPLQRGGVLRADAELDQAGGKGVNISRAAQAAGVPTVAVFPAPPDSPYTTELQHLGIACRPVASPGTVRVNLTLTEPDGTTTKINSAGSGADPALLAALADALADAAAGARWVVLAGSLPPGAPDLWYAELCERLDEVAQVAVDTSEGPLTQLAQRLGTALPDLLKPNGEELALLTRSDAAALESDPVAAARAAGRLVEQGAGAVLATLGSAGAVLVTPEGAWRATAPPTAVVSTVGAGDCSLFGYLGAELDGAPPAERLRRAVAYGSAAAALPGTTVPTPGQVRPDLVEVHALDTASSTPPVPSSHPGR